MHTRLFLVAGTLLVATMHMRINVNALVNNI